MGQMFGGRINKNTEYSDNEVQKGLTLLHFLLILKAKKGKILLSNNL